MDRNSFLDVVEKTFVEIRRLTATKGVEYSRSDDQLANFKRTGEDTSLHPVKVWQVFFNKHLDAIKHFTNRAGTIGSMYYGTSEPIEGRIDDAILYLILLKALIHDGRVIKTEQLPSNQAAMPKPSDTAVLMGRNLEERDEIPFSPKVDPRFEHDADRNKPFKGVSVDYSGLATLPAAGCRP